MKFNLLKEYIYFRFINVNKIISSNSEKKTEDEEFDIVISTDDGFVKTAIVLIKSLKNINCNVNLYIINMSLSKKGIDLINISKPQNVTIKIINISKDQLQKLPISNKWPIEAWSRILIPQYINKKKILYLDCDCVIVEDIRNIYDGFNDKYLIGGVKSPNAKKRLKDTGGDLSAINSGVCLMNLDRLREFDFVEKVIKYAKNNKDILVMPDQDSINAVCKGEILNITPNYNLMNICMAYSHKDLEYKINDNYYNKDEYEKARKEPKIIHFNGGPFNRPWVKGLRVHPYRKIYKVFNNKK